jgi:hypothetical protein
MSTQQLRETFEAQFEAAGEERYLYRRNQKGEPIPVTAEERDRFVREFGWRIRLVMGGMIVGLLGFWGVLIWWTVSRQEDLPRARMYAGTIIIAVAVTGLMYWVRGAPARELDGRSSVGRERSAEEMRAIFFRKITYGRLAGVAAVGAGIALSRATRENIFVGWHRFWLVLGAAAVLIAAVQAFRKWRFESEHPQDISPG